MSQPNDLRTQLERYRQHLLDISTQLNRLQHGDVADDVQMVADALAHTMSPISARPTVVCLCGSTRFSQAFQEANLRETLAGRIVLTIGCDMRSDAELFARMTEDERAKVKRDLDELHKRKIDLADQVLILNVGGYIGESTRSELEYATARGKRVRYLEEAQPHG